MSQDARHRADIPVSLLAAAGQDEEGRRARRAERRRRAQERVFDNSVPSPCITVCQLDPRTDLCIGCLRHVDEIRDWPIMTAAEKRTTLERIEARKNDGGTPQPGQD